MATPKEPEQTSALPNKQLAAIHLSGCSAILLKPYSNARKKKGPFVQQNPLVRTTFQGETQIYGSTTAHGMKKTLAWRKSVVVYSYPKVRVRERTEGDQIARRRMRRNIVITEEEDPDRQENGDKVSTPRGAMEDARRKRLYKRKRLTSRRRRMLDRGRTDDDEPFGSLERNQKEKKPEEKAKQQQNQRPKQNDAPLLTRRKGAFAHVKARVDTGITSRESGKSLKRTSSYVVIDSISSESREMEIPSPPEPKEPAKEAPKTESPAVPPPPPVDGKKVPSPYETERQIDFLVTTLASMMPACRSEAQIENLVGYFAEAFRHKVVAISVKEKAKSAKSITKPANELNVKKSVEKPVHNSELMGKTASWVLECTEVSKSSPPVEQERQKTFKREERRHKGGSQTFRKPGLMRSYGEMCILKDSGDRKENSDSDKDEIPEEIEEDSDVPPVRPEVRFSMANPTARHIKKCTALSYNRR